MPLVSRIEQNILVIESSGVYTHGEMDVAVIEGVTRADIAPLEGVLVDLRNSRSILERSTRELHEAAALYASYKDRVGGRVAIVAASDASYGLGRMASVTAEHLGLRVFVCRDLAQAWEFLLA